MSSSSRNREMRLAVLLGVLVLLVWLLWEGASRGIGKSYSSHNSVRVRQELFTFQSALNLFRMNAGRYPTTEEGLGALVERPVGSDLEQWEMTLRKVPLDPWQNSYRYEFPPRHGRHEPDISSAGPDMSFGTVDDIGNWEDE